MDPDTTLDHMLGIASARRAQLGAGSQALAAAAASAPSARAPRRALFHHTPYTQQEPLDALPPGDVAAVLEVVLGRAGGGVAPSALTGRCDQEAPDMHWRSPGDAPAGAAPVEAAQQQQHQQRQQQPGSVRGSAAGGAAATAPPRDSLGQVCSCILAKMVIDTWLCAGPAAAAPLVLRMLQEALHHPHPLVRARPFDVLFNLSLHAALLVPGEEDLSSSGGGASSSDGGPGNMGSGVAIHGGLVAPQAPPELPGQLYARPQSPSGAQRARGGGPSSSSQLAAQLPSPRIHLPQQVMGQAPSSAASSGGTSPRSPLGGAGSGNPSAAGPTAQAHPLPGSPRSRLARKGTPAAESASRAYSPDGSGGGTPQGAAGSGSSPQSAPRSTTLEREFDAWLRTLLFELLCMLTQVGTAQGCGCRESMRAARVR